VCIGKKLIARQDPLLSFSLKLGDSIRRAIDKGLSQSRFGVVVLSKAFFKKKWPQYELDGLAEREMKGKDKVILPVSGKWPT